MCVSHLCLWCIWLGDCVYRCVRLCVSYVSLIYMCERVCFCLGGWICLCGCVWVRGCVSMAVSVWVCVYGWVSVDAHRSGCGWHEWSFVSCVRLISPLYRYLPLYCKLSRTNLNRKKDCLLKSWLERDISSDVSDLNGVAKHFQRFYQFLNEWHFVKQFGLLWRTLGGPR